MCYAKRCSSVKLLSSLAFLNLVGMTPGSMTPGSIPPTRGPNIIDAGTLENLGLVGDDEIKQYINQRR